MKFYTLLLACSLPMSVLYAQKTNQIADTGWIGIGTTQPTSVLTVDPKGRGSILLGNPSSGSGGYTGLNMGISALKDGFGYIDAIKSSGSSYGNLILNKYNGNVGIGDSVPIAKLDVKGNLLTESIELMSKAGTQAWPYLDFHFNNIANEDYNVRIQNQANHHLLIKASGGDVYVPIEGILAAKKVKVTTTGWPDYVFSDHYDLPSLASVKAYIDEHQHLPEVPSAAEIDQKGQDLGELNKVLLKKVEELTLYLLEQQKVNEDLTRRLEALEHK